MTINLMIFLDPNFEIDENIPVNAVATALKDYFSKRLPPLLPIETMNQLSGEISSKLNTMLGWLLSSG